MTRPDFIIIGRPKSGTTTLSKWLQVQPDVFFCRTEEPGFFDLDWVWERGVDWYEGLFNGAKPGQRVGEGSTGYTHPQRAETAAQRIGEVTPNAKLIYQLRHPVDRLRSEYRHRRMLGDETRPFLVSLHDAGWNYFRQSMYFDCLKPYIDRFPREQILVTQLEQMGPEGTTWPSVLRHLELPARPAPGDAHNVSAERGLYRGPIKLRRNVEIRRRLSWLPGPIKRIPSRLLRRRGPEFDAMLEDSRTAIPDEMLEPVWADIARLEDWLGVAEPLWSRGAGTAKTTD